MFCRPSAVPIAEPSTWERPTGLHARAVCLLSNEDPGTGGVRYTTHLLRLTGPYLPGLLQPPLERQRSVGSVMAQSERKHDHESRVLSTVADAFFSALRTWVMLGSPRPPHHAVPLSRCATDVPQGQCSGAVPADHEGGSKPLMTCANTGLRHRARTDDLRIQNEQAAYPRSMWHKMCHKGPCLGWFWKT